jgi:hypothetical protein
MSKLLVWVCGAALLALALMPQRNDVSTVADERVDVGVVHQTLSFEDMVRGSDIILDARIARISPTLWNQDGGAYWEETVVDSAGLETIQVGLPYYEVELDAGQTIIDAQGLAAATDQPLVLTIVGMSPMDKAHDGDAGVMVFGLGESALAEGQQGLFFVQQSSLAWRDGERQVLRPTGAPAQSYLATKADGQLFNPAAEIAPSSQDEIVSRILAIRGGAGETR